MSAIKSRSEAVEIGNGESSIDDRELELLIKEARRLRRRRWFNIGVVLIVAVVAISIIVVQTSNPTPVKAPPKTSLANFVNSMKRSNDTRFVATYHVFNFLYFQTGTIVVAQIPSPPGTKMMTNADGYSGSGRFAYLFHGANGRIAQWIKNGTNVSACATLPSKSNIGRLQCSRPSPYLPSNGFAEQDTGFVPTYVLYSIQGFLGLRLPKHSTVTTNFSPEFGSLRCLTQFPSPTTQTTCINRAGYVVSWVLQNGSGYSSRATLTSLGRHPTATDFKVLVRPTKSLILPAV